MACGTRNVIHIPNFPPGRSPLARTEQRQGKPSDAGIERRTALKYRPSAMSGRNRTSPPPNAKIHWGLQSAAQRSGTPHPSRQPLLSSPATSGTYTSLLVDSRGTGGKGSRICPGLTRRTPAAPRAAPSLGDGDVTSPDGSRSLRRPPGARATLAVGSRAGEVGSLPRLAVGRGSTLTGQILLVILDIKVLLCNALRTCAKGLPTNMTGGRK